jgi:hypothetical protein
MNTEETIKFLTEAGWTTPYTLAQDISLWYWSWELHWGMRTDNAVQVTKIQIPEFREYAGTMTNEELFYEYQDLLPGDEYSESGGAGFSDLGWIKFTIIRNELLGRLKQSKFLKEDFSLS